ncbi:Outer membrane usher protein fimD precursor [Kluyvera cryocrescens]|uniref:Outer membrane usher protein fimD n=1 Tax=Kluyvera cryocrescens TaxID=580 RepID=A0A485A5A8_KLUCR|nr:Outer membrane usher protein fimD precursor [Kluyvera cryocrescens]
MTETIMVDSVYTYVSRDIKVLKSQLTMGDNNTKNDVFDSFAFRGAELASDGRHDARQHEKLCAGDSRYCEKATPW